MGKGGDVSATNKSMDTNRTAKNNTINAGLVPLQAIAGGSLTLDNSAKANTLE